MLVLFLISKCHFFHKLKGPAIAFPYNNKESNNPNAPNYCISNCITSLYVQAIITLVIAGVCALIAIVILILGCFKKKPSSEPEMKDSIKNSANEENTEKS